MRPRETFSPAQCRAALGLAGMTPEDLAGRARLELEAIDLYTCDQADLGADQLAAIGRAFYELGVIAIPANVAGEGVRFWMPPRTSFASPAPRPDPFPEFDAWPAERKAHAVGEVCRDLATALQTPPHLRTRHGR